MSFLQIPKSQKKDNILTNKNKLHNNSNNLLKKNINDNNTIGNLIHLQQTFGNQIVKRMLESKSVQTKPKISQTTDTNETKTDKIAVQMSSKEDQESKSESPDMGQSEPLNLKFEKKQPEIEEKERKKTKEDKVGAVTVVKESSAEDEEKKLQAKELTPSEAIDPAVRALDKRARKLKTHSPVENVVGAAQSAAIEKPTEQKFRAAEATLVNIDNTASQVPGEFKQEDFKTQLAKALHEAIPIPNSIEEAERLIDHGDEDASNILKKNLQTQKNQAVGAIGSAVKTEVNVKDIKVSDTPELITEESGSKPKPVSAASVVPPAMSEEKLDYSSHSQDVDVLMAQNNITKEQLERGNDPDFNSVLESRNIAETNQVTVLSSYRETEASLRDQSRNSGQQILEKGLEDFYDNRTTRVKNVASEQEETRTEISKKHLEITTQIEGIKEETKNSVQEILDDMDSNAEHLFGEGLGQAEKAYSEVFEEEKGGILGRIGDFFTGSRDETLENAFKQAKKAYESKILVTIDVVASYVNSQLAKAKTKIAEGKKKLDVFIQTLDKSQQTFAKQAKEKVMNEFDSMTSEIDNRRDSLVNNLVQQYKNSQDRLKETEQRLREENKSLWDRVYDATVGVVEKVLEFKNLLLGILSSAADVVEAIISDPIGFLGKFIDGIKTGLSNFLANILDHLQTGFMDWLLGSLREGGVEVPETFDLPSLLKLVVDILGITYEKIRTKVAKVVGEEKVAKVEKAISEGQKIMGQAEEAFKIFQIIKTEGFAGLWNYIKEMIGDLTDIFIQTLKDWVIQEAIEGGIKWIMGLLTPASAFIKAAMAIYDIFKFFIEKAAQLADLVKSIIGTISAIASGNIEIVATAVENALAKAIPIVIGFLASLVGMGNAGDKIKEVVGVIQKKVDVALDWVVQKIADLVKAVGKMLGFGKEEEAVGKVGIGKEEEEKEKIPMTKDERSKEGHEKLDEIVARSKNSPYDVKTLQKELDNLKSTYEFKKLEIVSLQNNVWLVVSSMSPEEEDYIVATGNYGCSDIFNSYPPTMVQMTITNIKTKRQSSTTEKVRKPYRDMGLEVDGGHLIALFLGGPDIVENIVPMSSGSNRITYLHMFEKNIEDKFKNKSPLEILCMRVSVQYPSETNFMKSLPFEDIEGLWEDQKNPALTEEQKAFINLIATNKDILLKYPDSLKIQLIFFNTVEGTIRQEEHIFDPRRGLGALRPVLQKLGIKEKVRETL